jgi:hypothetical protein
LTDAQAQAPARLLVLPQACGRGGAAHRRTGRAICDACVDLCNRILAGKPTPGFAGWEALGDGELLASLGYSQAATDGARDVLQRQVDILRRRDISWAAIGTALDISRQAAWERFS